MRILIIGSGGREHALAWRLAQSPRVTKVFVAPGNGGTARDPRFENVPITALDELADFAARESIGLTVVGPEAPLAAGVVDIFRARGLPIFGPTQAAAQLEASKDFAKQFMVRHRIPTATYQTFTDAAAAHAHVEQHGAPIVIKADGLAAGKGVVVAQTLEEAHAAIDSMLGGRALGEAGARVVIEEFLQGEEASFIVVTDGTHVLPLATSQDHKRLGDGDTGPNTGGMGAYSPAPIITPELHDRIMHEVIRPTIEGMRADGTPYVGFLYAGLMITPGSDAASTKIKVLEFNCRMGDPETQPILMRVKGDLLPVLENALAGTLDQAALEWDPRVALGVVVAAANYPATPRTGDRIDGLPEETPDCIVFHAGTRLVDGQVVTAGGRVLCVTALADTVEAAQRRAYEVVDQIHFEGMQVRRDIGWRAVAASRK